MEEYGNIVESDDDICLSCKQRVEVMQKAISCDSCDRWQHIECGSICTDEEYELILAGMDTRYWKCDECTMADKCIHCSETVLADHRAISCGDCNRWQHIQCEGICSEKDYCRAVRGEEALPWKCKICKDED